MSDTSAFLAGCATTGVAVLVLLVARIGLDDAPPQIESIVPGQETPVPLPPPPPNSSSFNGQADSNLRRELERQQDVSEQLKQQVDEHRATIRTLEDRLERQREDTNAIAADLRETQRTVNDLANQPPSPVPPARGEDSPATLLWIGSAVVVVVLGGGGLLLLLAVNLLSQSPRRRRRPHLIYPQPPSPPHYPYYGPEVLPPSLPSRPMVYETYDYDD